MASLSPNSKVGAPLGSDGDRRAIIAHSRRSGRVGLGHRIERSAHVSRQQPRPHAQLALRHSVAERGTSHGAIALQGRDSPIWAPDPQRFQRAQYVKLHTNAGIPGQPRNSPEIVLFQSKESKYK